MYVAHFFSDCEDCGERLVSVKLITSITGVELQLALLDFVNQLRNGEIELQEDMFNDNQNHRGH